MKDSNIIPMEDVDYSSMPDYQEESRRSIDLVWNDGDMLADTAKAPVFLINNILEDDSHGLLSGASMAFKTFADLKMVHSICSGDDFFGNQVFKTGKVLYICGEGKGALSRRIKALKLTDGDFKENLMVLDTSIYIDDSNHMAALKKVIKSVEPVLVVIDTFSSLVSTTDENSNSSVATCLSLIKDTCRTSSKTSSLVIHHHGKDASKGMRGASAFKNNVDFAFKMERIEDSMITIFSCEKQKDGENFQDITMKAHVVELGLERQDGSITTSLVLKPTDDLPSKKSRTGGLTQDETHVMNSMRYVYDRSSHSIPADIMQEHSIDKKHSVILIADWREQAYKRLSVDCKKDDEATINNAKKAKFSRVRKALFKKNRIIEYGEYAWYYDYSENQKNDKS